MLVETKKLTLDANIKIAIKNLSLAFVSKSNLIKLLLLIFHLIVMFVDIHTKVLEHMKRKTNISL